jgi:hypothetical protein
MSSVPKRGAACGETIARINHHRGSLTEFLPADESDYPLLNKRYIAFERAATSFLRKQGFLEPNHITYLRFAVCLFLLLSFGRLSYLQILTLAALNGAFLIVLTGKTHPSFARAKRLLNHMSEKPEWSTIASFYLKGIDLIHDEIEGACKEGPEFALDLQKKAQRPIGEGAIDLS